MQSLKKIHAWAQMQDPLSRLKVDFSIKSESRTFSFLVEKSYNKTVIDFNFGRHEGLSTLKSDIHLGLAASVNYHFFG